ncbi:MAG: DUF188 domain-containing protein [Candidatus Marsarchaeota archaeon]|jgi:rRNA-processing protein FCF1|nr:DUF188 domain-containing protein [Candidatus Marsarchaeota archaeon]MCL5418335.1 DUF188 domain-containing protein [Candidatus Marsarchaeota archaeon]
MKDVFEIARKRWHGARLLIPGGAIRELTKKARNSGKKGSYAKAALASLHGITVVPMRSSSNVDSWIVANARPIKAIVITNDTALAKRLLETGVRVFKLSISGSLRAFVSTHSKN